MCRYFIPKLNEHYVCFYMFQVRAVPGAEPKIRVFDADHERRRKEQLDKQFNRTKEMVRVITLMSRTIYDRSMQTPAVCGVQVVWWAIRMIFKCNRKHGNILWRFGIILKVSNCILNKLSFCSGGGRGIISLFIYGNKCEIITVFNLIITNINTCPPNIWICCQVIVEWPFQTYILYKCRYIWRPKEKEMIHLKENDY